jgi:hypothetical protein
MKTMILALIAFISLNASAEVLRVHNRIQARLRTDRSFPYHNIKATFDGAKKDYYGGTYYYAELSFKDIFVGEEGFETEADAMAAGQTFIDRLAMLALTQDALDDIDYQMGLDFRDEDDVQFFVETTGALMADPDNIYYSIKSDSTGLTKGGVWKSNNGWYWSMTLRLPVVIEEERKVNTY